MRVLLSFGVWICVLISPSTGQDHIRNGSLEGVVPQLDKLPQFWNRCASSGTPDIQPVTTSQIPLEGSTYLGLAVFGRNPDHPELALSKESFGQRIDTLIAGFEYLITVHLSYDPKHRSSEGESEAPARLNVYVGNNCDEKEHIWQTPLIDHEDWKPYERNYIASCHNTYLMFEATHGDLLALNAGYLLVDQISMIPVNNESALDTVVCSAAEEPIDSTPTLDTLNSCKMFIPNAFTPNRDGHNDVFKIEKKCHVKDFQIEIYNRWGNLVFKSTDPDFSWDGHLQNDHQSTVALAYHISFSFETEDAQLRSDHHTGILYLVR